MISGKQLRYALVVTSGVLALGGALSLADDKDGPGLSGTWVRKEGELKLEFVDKTLVKIFPHGENPVIVLTCEYKTGKDGLVKAKITDIDGNPGAKEHVKDKLPVGSEFTFNWKAQAGSATLDNVKGEHIELFKSHLEGEYNEKK